MSAWDEFLTNWGGVYHTECAREAKRVGVPAEEAVLCELGEKKCAQCPWTASAAAAKAALTVQDACNLCGILYTWRELASTLMKALSTTNAVNEHPAMQLFASKVHNLTGMGLSDLDAFSKAYEVCKRLSDGPS